MYWTVILCMQNVILYYAFLNLGYVFLCSQEKMESARGKWKSTEHFSPSFPAFADLLQGMYPMYEEIKSIALF